MAYGAAVMLELHLHVRFDSVQDGKDDEVFEDEVEERVDEHTTLVDDISWANVGDICTIILLRKDQKILGSNAMWNSALKKFLNQMMKRLMRLGNAIREL